MNEGRLQPSVSQLCCEKLRVCQEREKEKSLWYFAMPFEIQADTIENLWMKFIKIRHVYRGRRLDLQYCSQVSCFSTLQNL